ncbi:DoxX family protein [Marinibaculum pumilum]|uniref:DoxX family protein n=1 Tax=Marinibaculum pumilum TaxID=1766165 RepID=A0ABV7L112_9PROT
MTEEKPYPEERGGLVGLVAAIFNLLHRFPHWLLALVFRIGVGGVFWKSGLTKVVTTESGSWPILPPTLGGSTVSLFENVYAVPLLAPAFAAHMASYIELLMPVLLLFGLGSRFAAAMLLGMTLVIEIFVFPLDYLSHLLWAGPLIYILCYGPGALSLDYFIARKFFAPKD